jgi:hypothetical protein
MTASLPPQTTSGTSANSSTPPEVARTLEALERFGLLLLSDPALPSLVGMIVDEPLRASWWGHPRGPVIYATMNRVDDDARVLSTKLIAGKVTYVHQRLWPALVAVASAAEDWQIDGLTPDARWLLGEVSAAGELPTHAVVLPPEARAADSDAARRLAPRRVADLARDLERRLLVHATEIHTPSGAHAKVLQTWQRWAAEVHLPPPTLSPAQARAALEAAAASLAAAAASHPRGGPGTRVELPWRPRPARQPRQTRLR